MQTTNQPFIQLSDVLTMQPAVSVVVPFEPHLRSKSEITTLLNNSVDRAIRQIEERYADQSGRVVISRLKNIMSQLNFSSFKKSVAIFASPVFEKIIYLPFEVEPYIQVASGFNIQEAIKAKKENKSFLLVNLSRLSSTIYLGEGASLSRVNMNMRDQPDNPVTFPKGKSFTDRNELREILLRSFMRRTDQALHLLLKAYPLPVFVTGSAKVMGEFRKISANSNRVVAYIDGYFAKADQQSLKQMLHPHLLRWQEVKRQDLLQRINTAANANHLASGIREVWKNARAKNASLLVLEEGYSPAAILHAIKTETTCTNCSVVNTTIDEIIEKVLEAGGDVEIVEPGTLAGYEPIVLIERYASAHRS